MILAVGNVKGGVGKTTLAVNLTIALVKRKRDVLLVDGDEQGTAMMFTTIRSDNSGGKPGYSAVELKGKDIRSQVPRLAAKHTDTVIDVGGRDSEAFRAALLVADTVLIPVQPRSFDLWGVQQTMVLVQQARQFNEKLQVIVVLNAADSQGKDNEATGQALAGMEDVTVAPGLIVRRKAFPNAATDGLSVLETDDSKAKAELLQLATAIFGK